MPTTRRLVPVLLTLVALTLAGCTGGDDGEAVDDTAALQDRLAAAKQTIDEAETVDVSLATERVPDGVSGLLSAEGQGNHDPAFTGEVTVSTGGSTLTAEVIAIADEVWAKTSFAPTFLSIDPASLQAPNPATLLDTENGITQILTSTEDLAEGDRSRDGETVLTAITGTLPGSVVSTILPSAQSEGSFDVTYRLTDDDELADATMTGPFYGEGSSVTYTVRLDTSDEPVEITAP